MDYSGLRWFILDLTGIATVLILLSFTVFPLIYTLHSVEYRVRQSTLQFFLVPCCRRGCTGRYWQILPDLIRALPVTVLQRYSQYIHKYTHIQFYTQLYLYLAGEYSTLICLYHPFPPPIENIFWREATEATPVYLNLTHLNSPYSHSNLLNFNPLIFKITAILQSPLWWYTVA